LRDRYIKPGLRSCAIIRFRLRILRWHTRIGKLFLAVNLNLTIFMPTTPRLVISRCTQNIPKIIRLSDLKEFFHLYQRQDLPASMSDRTWQLFSDMLDLAAEILGWIEDTTPDVFPAQIGSLQQMIANSPNHLLRILHYPPLSGTEPPGSVRAAAHQDINLITLLPAATNTGLEVQDRQGSWYALPCCLGEIVINVGDMLQVASGGYYRSTTHRVVNPIGAAARRSRYAMPLFLHPHPAAILSTTGLVAGAYLEQRLKQIGIYK
jgi:hypothetical protein